MYYISFFIFSHSKTLCFVSPKSDKISMLGSRGGGGGGVLKEESEKV